MAVKYTNEKYKRFMLFQYVEYYPSGGLGDMIESFDSTEDANKYIIANCLIRTDLDLLDRIQGQTIDLKELNK